MPCRTDTGINDTERRMQNGYDNKIKKTPVHTGIEKDGAGDEDGCVFSHLSAFCAGGRKCEIEIPSMPGQFRYSLDRMPEVLNEMADAGVTSVMLFGIPDIKDECETGAWIEDGIIQKALRKAKRKCRISIILQTCVCVNTYFPRTLRYFKRRTGGQRQTLPMIAKIALSQAQAGADMVAPSDMMDGRVSEIRVCWISTVTQMCRSCPMRLSMLPPFTVHFGMPPDLPLLLETGKVIRWIIITVWRP